MSDTSAFDPYAPPKADIDGPPQRARARDHLKPELIENSHRVRSLNGTHER